MRRSEKKYRNRQRRKLMKKLNKVQCRLKWNRPDNKYYFNIELYAADIIRENNLKCQLTELIC